MLGQAIAQTILDPATKIAPFLSDLLHNAFCLMPHDQNKPFSSVLPRVYLLFLSKG